MGIFSSNNSLNKSPSKLLSIAKVFLIVILALFTVTLVYLGVKLLSEKKITVSNVMVTNVTDSSATITFLTKELSNPSVIVSLEDNFNIINQLNKIIYTDDRDSSDRYSHHITITGLNNNSKYYFRISTGLKNVNITYPALETGPVLDSVLVPSPTYGRMEDNNFKDSIVYLYLGNGDGSPISTILNDNNAFTLDKSNVRLLDLSKSMSFKDGDPENFKLVNNYGTYSFFGKVGEDQPVTIELTKDDASVLGASLNPFLTSPVMACEVGRTYYECCATGKSKKVTVTACNNGSDSGWSSGSCNQADSGCGTIAPTPAPNPTKPTTVPTTTSPNCQDGKTQCKNSRTVQICSGGNWNDAYQCEVPSQKCGNGDCVDVNATIISKPTTVTSVTQYSSCGIVGYTSCGVNGICQNTGCVEPTPKVTETTNSKCDEGKFQCSGKNIQKCIGGNWNTINTCDGASQKCVDKSESCVSVNPSSQKPAESLNVVSVTEKTITAAQPKTGETTTDCSMLANSDAIVKCYKDREVAQVSSSNGGTHLSDCLLISNETVKQACMKNLEKSAPSTNQTAGCDGDCKTKTPLRNIPSVATSTDPCLPFANPISGSMLSGCCASNQDTPTCNPKAKVVNSNVKPIVVADQYLPIIHNTFGDNGCGIATVSIGLANSGVMSYEDSVKWFADNKSTIGYDSSYGIMHGDLKNATGKICKIKGCSTKSYDIKDGDEFLDTIVDNHAKGNKMILAVAWKETPTGTVIVPASNFSEYYKEWHAHFVTIKSIDPVSKKVTLFDTLGSSREGRNTETVVTFAELEAAASGMEKTDHYVQVIAPDKSLDSSTDLANSRSGLVGIRDDTSPTSELILNKGLISYANAATFSGSVDNTGVYKIASVPGYKLFTTEVRVFDKNDLKLKFFNDQNGDGVKQDNEEYINNPVQVNLEKVSEGSQLELKLGWNLVNMNMVTNGVKTANDLLIEIARQGGYATHVTTYRNGKWVMFSQRAGQTFGQDFNIVPTEGYFVKVLKATSLVLQGNLISLNTPIYISTGWNLLGIRTDKDKKASTLIEDMNKTEGIVVDTVTKYTDGRYSNLVKDTGTIYGQDFVIDPNLGYFIRASKGGKSVSSY